VAGLRRVKHVDHDTAAFAVNAIRSLWKLMGRERYPNANSLLITADGGGSNGSRVRLWKVELQKLADELGVSITVCHLPPGASKWNKIEHRGLLRLHSRYGPLDRSAAQCGLCHEAPIRPIARPNRSSATRSIDNSLGGTFLHW